MLAHPDEDVLYGGISVDGVAYALADGVIGLLASVLTGRRFLLAAVRKRRLCSCGCRGRCALWCIFAFLTRGLRVQAAKMFPMGRHAESLGGN